MDGNPISLIAKASDGSEVGREVFPPGHIEYIDLRELLEGVVCEVAPDR